GAFAIIASGKIVAKGGGTLSATGGAGSAGTAGTTGGAASTGADGTDGAAGGGGVNNAANGANGAEGGSGGNGARGGAGGDGAGGAGGAGGTVKLIATDIQIAGVTVNVSGGSGGAGGGDAAVGSAGGGGRTIVLDNTADASGTPNIVGSQAVSGLPATAGGVHNAMFDGDVETARIVGLSYGAGYAGLLLDKDGKLLDGRTLDFDAATGGVQAADGNALVAVMRFDSMAALAAATSGKVVLDQDYTGYDVVVVVNLTGTASTAGVTLNTPTFGVNGERNKALAVDGYLTQTWDAAKQQWVTSVTQVDKLLPGAVWITLVRETDTAFTTSVVAGGTTVSLDAKGLPTAIADGQVKYIKVGQTAAAASSDLQGLDEAVRATNASGTVFYGVDKSTNTLVVMDQDGTVRQAFRQGVEGRSELGALGTIAVFSNQVWVNATNAANETGVAVFTRAADNTLTFSFFSIGTRNAQPAAPEGSSGLYTFTITPFVAGGSGVTTTLKVDAASASLWSTNAAGVTTEVVRDGKLLDSVPTANNAPAGVRPTFTSLTDMRMDGAFVRINATVSTGGQGQLQLFRDANTGTLYFYSFTTSSGTPLSTSDGTAGQSVASAIRYVARPELNGFDVYSGTTLIQEVRQGVDEARGATQISDFAVAPGGKYVLALNANGAISVFERDDTTGKVNGRAIQVFRQGSGGASGLVGASSLIIGDRTGNVLTVYVTSVGNLSERGGIATFQIDLSEVVTPRDSVLRHTGVENLVVETGGGSDRISYVGAVAAGVTSVTINTGSGADSVVLSDVGALTTVNLGAGDDSVSIRAETAGARITALGGDGNDAFDVVTTGAGAATQTTLSGEGGNDAFVISRIGTDARLNASGGAGDDTFTVYGTGTGAVSVLEGNAGKDSFALVRLAASSTTVYGADANGGTAGDDVDTVSVTGQGIAAGATTTLNGGAGIDALVFDPGSGTMVTYTAGGALTSPAGALVFENGQVGVSGFGRVVYSSFGIAPPPPAPPSGGPARALLPPSIAFAPVSATQEGAGLTLRVNVADTGSAALTNGVVSFDLDGDGQFGDKFAAVVDGVALLTLGWLDLLAAGISDNGAFTFAAQAVNEDGLSAVTSVRVSVADAKPTVSLVASASTVTFGNAATVSFSASDPSAADVPTGWQVDWGDGTVQAFGASVREAGHTYQAPGTFQVKAGVLDKDNPTTATFSAPVAVNVVMPAPSAAPGGANAVTLAPATMTAGGTVQLAVTASGTPTGYIWRINNVAVPALSGATPTLTWAQAKAAGIDSNGSFANAISVEVVYGSGGSAQSVIRQAALTVANSAPTFLSFTQLNAGTEGATTPDAQASVGFVGATDASAFDAARLRYDFDFNNDGTWDLVDQSTASVLVPAAFAQVSGTLVVKGQVKDPSGALAVGYASVTIADVPASLDIAGTGTQVEGSPYEITLTANDPGFVDPNLWWIAGDRILGWTVDWGDGDTQSLSSGTSKTLSHAYRDDMGYVITVSARDSEGVSNSATHAVAITNAPPVLSTIAVSTATPSEGGSFHLTGDMADAGADDARRLTVDWGDGTSTVRDIAVGATHFDLTKSYAQDSGAGSYNVTVTLSDLEGGTDVQTFQQRIANAAPVVTELSLSASVVDQMAAVQISGRYTDLGAADQHDVSIDLGNGTILSGAQVQVNTADRSFTATAVYPQAGSYQVKAIVTDRADPASKGERGTSVTIVNPQASIRDITVNGVSANAQRAANAPVVTIDKGETVAVAFTLSDPGQGGSYVVQLDWGDGSPPALLAPAGSVYDAATNRTTNTYAAARVFTRGGGNAADPSGTVVRVLVGEGTALPSLAGSFAVAVRNAAPVIGALTVSPSPAQESGEVTARLVFSDADALDTHAALFTWGDGTTTELDAGARQAEAGGGYSFTATHRYADNASGGADYTVSATVKDQDFGIATNTARVPVANVAPTQIVLSLDESTIVEGESVTLRGTFLDPGNLDTHTVTVDWGFGATTRHETFTLTGGERSFVLQHQYEDGVRLASNGQPLPVRVTITDKDGGQGTGALDVSVSSAPPAIADLKLNASSISEGAAVRLTGRIVDADVLDAHRVEVNWGDGHVQTVALALGDRAIDLTHTYADDARTAISAERYPVSVRVVDAVGAEATAALDIAVTNLAPRVDGLSFASAVDENGIVTLTGRVSDAGAGDAMQLSVLWGDEAPGAAGQSLVIAGDGSFTATHRYLDDARSAGAAADSYSLTLRATDGVTASTTTR
ncbi:beta strand repeat-containing protein, partial [Roseixanthobacter liquoris]|uniref:beta strand repeat-containing protein n=1 Tax=Roseixanthobacter liquoris TaxID=3119921 RepID=UPI00372CDDCF